MKKLIVALLMCVNAAFGQSKSDYFIIADPADYTIFNQFEQSMSDADKRELLTFAPLRIETEDKLLGDQISRATKCSYEGSAYFILKDDDGKFTGEKKTGRQVFKNCLVIEDTVIVRVGGSIKIRSPAGQVRTPGKGAEIVRFFKSGPRYYVGLAGEKTVFGWSDMAPENAWKKAEKAVVEGSSGADTSLSEMYRQRIREKIASANAAYRACFDHFNAHTNDQKSTPSWNCENIGAGMRCELSGPWKKGDQLSESTGALVQELENVLLGSGFGVRYDNSGVMDIRKRKASD